MIELLSVILLFSGTGGLDLSVTRVAANPLDTNGSAKSPYRIGVLTDYDPDTVKTYEANFPGVPSLVGDIRAIAMQEISEAGSLIVGEATLVVGGPPCTPFSKSEFWLAEKRESCDPNASLLNGYARVVREAQPGAFILEDVQGLTYWTHKAQFERLPTEMKSLGYNPQYQALPVADYGVPQLYRCAFIVGRRNGKRLELPTWKFAGDSEHTKQRDDEALPMHHTASKAFGELPEVPEFGEAVSGSWQELAAEIPPGGNYLWYTECKGGRNEFKWRTCYWTFLLRLSPDKPSSTIRAQPGPWVGLFHWENVIDLFNGQPAACRLRVSETKRLQIFPDNFQVIGDRATAQRQIGNAVPVELGKVVVYALAKQLGYISSIATSTDTCW